MSIKNNFEQHISVEVTEQKEPLSEQKDVTDEQHPFESAQLIVKEIEADIYHFAHSEEKIQSYPWVESATGIVGIQNKAAESIREFNERATQLQEQTMRALQTAVEQELASSEPSESTEDRLFDKELFLKEYAQYKKTAEEGGRNVGLYRFKDRFVKLVRSRRSMSPEKLTILKDRTKDLEHVFVPDDILDVDPTTRALVMPLAEGVIGNKLSHDEIENIPDDHWEAFETTIRTLSERGIPTDLTKRSNFIYDKQKGFQFIDLESISADGAPTEKFVEKDGKPYYFPFEHFRLFPKEYKGAKAMFTDISLPQET
jgi:hypothetical protein